MTEVSLVLILPSSKPGSAQTVQFGLIAMHLLALLLSHSETREKK